MIGIQNINTDIPSSYTLYQNYPNPFNPRTVIRFDIQKSEVRSQKSEVTLKIFDVLGHEVTTLVNEKLSPGTYSVYWNASEYPSGIYFYKLMTGEFVETKKMIVIR